VTSLIARGDGDRAAELLAGTTAALLLPKISGCQVALGNADLRVVVCQELP
jgi:hypothetical protein